MSHDDAPAEGTHAPESADGDAPEDARAAALFARLDALGIETATAEHEALFTVEQSKALRGDIPGAHCKNLFLRNKKGHMWLVVCPEALKVDLKALGEHMGSGRLSFASKERLAQHLGVIPGAVTPFGVMNDREGLVQVVLVASLLEEELLNFHPLTNTRTTTIRSADLVRFLEAENHAPTLLEL